MVICRSYFTLSTVIRQQFVVDDIKISDIFESLIFTR